MSNFSVSFGPGVTIGSFAFGNNAMANGSVTVNGSKIVKQVACKYCGTMVGDDARECHNCGAKDFAEKL